jgi:hypothetical protein
VELGHEGALKKAWNWICPLLGIGVIPLISLTLFCSLPRAITLREKTDVNLYFADDQVWSDDSRELTIVADTGYEDEYREFVINTDTQRTQKHPYGGPDPEDGYFSSTSPNGKQQVVVSGSYADGIILPFEIALVSSGSTNRVSLIKDGPQFEDTERITSPMVWSPNSKRIVFRTHIGATITHANWDKIYVVDVEKRKVVLGWTLTDIERSMSFGWGLTNGQIEILSVLGMLFGPLLTLGTKGLRWHRRILAAYYVLFCLGFLCWYGLMSVASSV